VPGSHTILTTLKAGYVVRELVHHMRLKNTQVREQFLNDQADVDSKAITATLIQQN
jgi:hypothetical protein